MILDTKYGLHISLSKQQVDHVEVTKKTTDKPWHVLLTKKHLRTLAQGAYKQKTIHKDAIVKNLHKTHKNIHSTLICPQNQTRTYCLIDESVKNANILQTLDIHVQKNAHLTFIHIQACHETATCVTIRHATVDEGATIKWIILELGSQFSQSLAIATLHSHAKSTQEVLSILSQSQELDMYTAHIHEGNSSESDILTRMVLLDSAKGLSQSLIAIKPHADESKAYEKQEALQLGKSSIAFAIPNLEIHNHNVQCTHGSTIGTIDPQKTQYLQSRCISQELAQNLIIQSYFTPILAQIPQRKRIEAYLEKKIS